MSTLSHPVHLGTPDAALLQQLSPEGPEVVHNTHEIRAMPCVHTATIECLVLWNLHLQAVARGLKGLQADTTVKSAAEKSSASDEGLQIIPARLQSRLQTYQSPNFILLMAEHSHRLDSTTTARPALASGLGVQSNVMRQQHGTPLTSLLPAPAQSRDHWTRCCRASAPSSAGALHAARCSPSARPRPGPARWRPGWRLRAPGLRQRTPRSGAARRAASPEWLEAPPEW